ncbi:uncharacterized protein LOC107048476 [Diachasma alloeum]|uniref:uncharacterized protein LOC107048476 n=1 Tax=Diachasma alloeum TaxID=454923 RepID=UPI000738200D|nr:uncharacterized protein LOC107048476 [Diachasma alloeum]
MTSHSAKELNALLTVTSEALNALEVLGSPTSQWDQVIVHEVSQRLSSKLREAWEVKVGSSAEYPSYKDFKDFLTGRARAMESIEINSVPRAPATKPSNVSSSKQSTAAKVHHGTAQPPQKSRPALKSAPSVKDTYLCSMYEADHYLTSCSSFRQLSVSARREVVERRYLCYNCLGRHSVRDCRSKTKRQYCGGLHHSMLHNQSSSQPQRPAQQRQQTNSTQQKAVPVVTYTHENDIPKAVTAPVVIRAKILLQALWIEKLGWDEPVSQTTAQRWSQFREELTQLSEITIPRWLGLLTDSVVEVHGFSDASQVAMSAVIYLKVLNKGKSQLTLVCSKTKVAPLKRLTIPRLELTAALLLAKLTKYVKDQLNLTNATTYLWTDSSVTLTWISSHSSRWKEFVKNRVALIQELTQQAHWRLVPGKENPADCASRGLSAHQLVSHKLWWKGPPWLHQDCSSWPTHALEKDLSADLEEKPGVLLHVKAHPIALWNLVDRFSSFNRLLRVTAICRRFIARLRKTPNSSLRYPLTLGDLEEARILWIKLTQAAHFKDQLRAISRGERFSKSHPLTKLTPFIDRQGVLRIGGRLKFAHIGPESRNQVIIPKESQLAQLLIGQAHLRTLHGGTQLTLRQLRSSYWILGGRAPVRSFILKCVNCTRQRGVRAQQLMGQLPPARLTPARAFLNTGIDYAGPVSLRSWKGRGHKSYKGWLAIFVCMTTSAVHLEVVSDYSAEGFIAAYRRFSSRRGIAHSLFSDCGTNFLGADKELKKLFSSGSAQSRQLAQLLINDGTQWSFNPPVLNSRPLEPLTDDPDDCSALTPGHFLIGQAPTTLPEPSLEQLNVSRLSRWQLIQQKLQGFWKRWSTGYLQRLQAISKWHHPTHQIRIGSLVLLTDERFPPAKWPLARVTALHPGSDGLTRVVTIRTAQTTLTRPIAKHVLLPISPSGE